MKVIFVLLIILPSFSYAAINMDLHWIEEDGQKIRLDWPRERKWAWKNIGEKLIPFLEVWVEIPPHIELRSTEKQMVRFVTQNKKKFVVLESRSSTRMFKFEQLKPERKKVGIVVEMIAATPYQLVHESCDGRIGVTQTQLAPLEQRSPILYLGVHCDNNGNAWVFSSTQGFVKKEREVDSSNTEFASAVVYSNQPGKHKFNLFDFNSVYAGSYELAILSEPNEVETDTVRKGHRTELGLRMSTMFYEFDSLRADSGTGNVFLGYSQPIDATSGLAFTAQVPVIGLWPSVVSSPIGLYTAQIGYKRLNIFDRVNNHNLGIGIAIRKFEVSREHFSTPVELGPNITLEYEIAWENTVSVGCSTFRGENSTYLTDYSCVTSVEFRSESHIYENFNISLDAGRIKSNGNELSYSRLSFGFNWVLGK